MATTPTPPAPNLKDPAVMLETLRLAYRSALDRGRSPISEAIRLSLTQERELGRRLAQYWDMDPKPTEAERKWHRPAEEDPFVAILRAARKGVKEFKRVLDDEGKDHA